MPFCRSLFQGLLVHKYWWPMTHFLPRHGRFCTWMKLWSKVKTEPNQMTLQSDVKIKNISKLTWIYHNTILKILIKSVPDVIKTTSSTFLKTSESEESIEHNIIFIKRRIHHFLGVKTLPFWCQIVTKKSGLVRNQDTFWCENEIFHFSYLVQIRDLFFCTDFGTKL